jgi:hypothetical protein
MNSRESSHTRHFAFCIVHCAFAIAASAAVAAPTITIDKVAQRWPWNNKVDITYTVADGTDLAAASRSGDGYLKIVFTAKVGDQTYTIDGARDVIARVNSGTHTVTWTNAPAGVKMRNCEMDATLHDIDAYYMLIDLTTGDYAFDTLQGSDTANAKPSAALERFNTSLFKTDMLVLRRVPRTSKAHSAYASGYPTGCDAHYGADTTETFKNSRKRWTTDRDFFVGVFATSIAQYYKVRGLGANSNTKPINGGLSVWGTLRNSKAPDTALIADNSSDSFFERLNALTGLSSGFDLPTEVMAEIARRGGTTTHYIWGDGFSIYRLEPKWASNPGDVACSDNGHPWGLYTTTGNGWEWCLDSEARPDKADAPDPWTPFTSQSANHMATSGPRWSAGESDGTTQARLSYRSATNNSETEFRVYYVAR